ncbi:MAG: hypothetical protein ACLS3C_18125 [Oscillospiraceae bacterium]
MAEQSYELMHKDDVVASLQLDDLSGAILKVTPGASPELLPLGGSQGADSLRKWWLRRAVPISQGNIASSLCSRRVSPPRRVCSCRNLGLSLSDHYWIKPNGSELTWKDVSLFSNSFRDPLESMQIQHPHGAASTSTQTPAYSPSASLQGDLIKKWLIVDDTRCLLKGNRGANSQQSLNEVLASMLHEKQGFANHVRYRPVKFTGSASEQVRAVSARISRRRRWSLFRRLTLWIPRRKITLSLPMSISFMSAHEHGLSRAGSARIPRNIRSSQISC